MSISLCVGTRCRHKLKGTIMNFHERGTIHTSIVLEVSRPVFHRFRTAHATLVYLQGSIREAWHLDPSVTLCLPGCLQRPPAGQTPHECGTLSCR